ncbi:MAG: hypothetical protein QGH21_06340, partial [Candidatus Poseidoniia archaeon]|nr:hypothetical protein [Candidatus Poseidoniia archaeon]
MSRKKKTLHVPEPPARPGEQPDFSQLKLSKAGEAPKPAVDGDRQPLVLGMTASPGST